jgi:hypothetical protein
VPRPSEAQKPMEKPGIFAPAQSITISGKYSIKTPLAN